jgi:hypothetical protein
VGRVPFTGVRETEKQLPVSDNLHSADPPPLPANFDDVPANFDDDSGSFSPRPATIARHHCPPTSTTTTNFYLLILSLTTASQNKFPYLLS